MSHAYWLEVRQPGFLSFQRYPDRSISRAEPIVNRTNPAPPPRVVMIDRESEMIPGDHRQTLSSRELEAIVRQNVQSASLQ